MSLFDEMRKNDPTGKKDNILSKDESYTSIGTSRRLTFGLSDGKYKSCNYAFLDDIDYSPDDGTITLTYTKKKVVLKGEKLEALFIALNADLPRIIVCKDERYKDIDSDKQEYSVSDITVELVYT